MDLPPAIAAQSDFGPDMLHIAVDKRGGIWVEKHPLTAAELYTVLTNQTHFNPRLPVFIGGDAATQGLGDAESCISWCAPTGGDAGEDVFLNAAYV